MLQSLLDRLARDGLHARAAVADTPGAAHALARFGQPGSPIIVLPGEQGPALAPLPVAALRLAHDLVGTLRRLGFEHIGHLARIPRALLARRFGDRPGLRLDQAFGRVPEPLAPLPPEHVLQRRTMFLEPLLTAEALAAATAQLVDPLCIEMEHTGLGARQLDLLFERIDRQVVATRIGTAHPSRDARHLARLLNERLNAIDPGLGVEAMCLIVSMAEPLQWQQQQGGDASPHDLARLVDRLLNRLGEDRLYQASPLESEHPELAVQRTPIMDRPLVGLDRFAAHPPGRDVLCHDAGPPARPALSLVSSQASQERTAPLLKGKPSILHLVRDATPPDECDCDGMLLQDPPLLEWTRPWAQTARIEPKQPWPAHQHAPSRLLDPPRQVAALAALPDQPPLAFTWRHRRHRICRADGPERVHGEWWRHDRKTIRDYYRVEDQNGQRFWLFREGNGLDLSTGNLTWFLHGIY